MKKYILLILILLIGCILFVYFSFGNPVKSKEMKIQFEKYVKTYYGEDYYMSRFNFDVMHRTYHSYFTSNSNSDFSFYVGQDNNTKLINDSYEYEKKRLTE